MAKYIAFLRAINVGVKNRIEKKELEKLFEDVKCTKIKSYQQTGNVFFTYEDEINDLRINLEKILQESLGNEIPVVIIEYDILKDFVRSKPFGEEMPDDEILYISFIQRTDKKIDLPIFSNNGDIELFRKEEQYILSRRDMKISKPGASPNELIEKCFEINATTRKWTSLVKIIESNGK